MNNSETYSFQIQYYNLDFNENITFTTLGNFILHAAGNHAQLLGFSIDNLFKQQKTWVLSRFYVVMDSYPKAGEILQIQTWVHSVETFFSTRKFRLFSQSGKQIGNASSTWAVIDINTRRPYPLSNIISNLDYVNGFDSAIKLPERVTLDFAPEMLVYSDKVKYSDMDINKHMTSMHYLEWILDAFDLDFLKSHTLKSVELNFLQELNFAEKVDVRLNKYENFYYAELYNQTNNASACKCKLFWESI